MSEITVATLIDQAARELRDAGVVKPRREANRLWAWQQRRSPGEAWLGRERPAGAGPARAFAEAVERRVRGEPLAYVIGHCGFRRLEIRCDSRALIPRPETEGVVDLALSLAPSPRTRCLDLGTGTGCLGLALADEGGFAVTGVDLSPPALELAALNVQATGLAMELVHSDLGSGLAGRCFDLIVSNPPYLTEAEYSNLDPSVRDWEPRAALVSGADGMDLTRRILRESVPLLANGGWIVIEIDSARGARVAELARGAGWEAIRVVPDLFGRDRYLAARRGPDTGGGE